MLYNNRNRCHQWLKNLCNLQRILKESFILNCRNTISHYWNILLTLQRLKSVLENKRLGLINCKCIIFDKYNPHSYTVRIIWPQLDKFDWEKMVTSLYTRLGSFRLPLFSEFFLHYLNNKIFYPDMMFIVR